MSQRITAVVEQGRLRPTVPLNLEEGTEVELTLHPVTGPQPEPPRRNVKDIIAEIAALPIEGGGDAFTSRDHDRILYGENGAR